MIGEYDENGTLDNYYSNSVIVKGESEITHTNKFSYGYGSEYKYDWEILKIMVRLSFVSS